MNAVTFKKTNEDSFDNVVIFNTKIAKWKLSEK